MLQKLAVLTVAATAVALWVTVLRGLILFGGIAIQGETLLLAPEEIVGFALRGALTLALYTGIGFAVGVLVRSPVAAIFTLGAAIAVESIARPITMLVVGSPNPAQYLPFGLVPDISGTNPLAAINDVAMPVMPGIGTLTAMFTLLAWSIVAISMATIRFCGTDSP